MVKNKLELYVTVVTITILGPLFFVYCRIKDFIQCKSPDDVLKDLENEKIRQ